MVRSDPAAALSDDAALDASGGLEGDGMEVSVCVARLFTRPGAMNDRGFLPP